MKLRHVFSTVLLTALAAMLPSVSSADTETVDGIEWFYSVSDGEAEIYKGYANSAIPSSTTGAITIPSTFGGIPVTSIGEYAFQYCGDLTNVTIPDSITIIRKCAFSCCSGLTSVTIPDSVTSIGDGAFGNCSGLTSMMIPDSVTNIGRSAFRNCGGLTNVTISGSVQYIADWTFEDCKGLTNVTIPDSVTSIRLQAFHDCSGLTSVMIPDSVTSIWSEAFSGCSGLTSMTIPDSVTSIGYRTFSFCSGLKLSVFKGRLPVEFSSAGLDYGLIAYPRAYVTEWGKVVPQNRFAGYTEFINLASPTVVSSTIRADAPTVMDVVYKVASDKETVKVRVLAFEDGEQSFAKVIRPTTFIDGTAENVGDGIAANVEHKLSWKVDEDYTNRLAKIKFEVLASEGELVPLVVRTIPASDKYGRMQISWNAITDEQWYDALLWLYASGDEGLTLNNGSLKNGNVALASGTSVYKPSVASYVYSKMGFNLLTGDALEYANEETRLGLSESNYCGYRMLDE